MRIRSSLICLTSFIGFVSAEETADLQISTGKNYSHQGTVIIMRGGKPAQGVRIRLDFNSSRKHDDFFTDANGRALVSISSSHINAFIDLDPKNSIRYTLHGIGLPSPLLIELPEFEAHKEASLPNEVSLVDNRELIIMPPLFTPQLVAAAPRGWRYESPLVGTIKLPSHEGIQVMWIELPYTIISIRNIAPFKKLKVHITNKLADEPASKSAPQPKKSLPSDAKP